MIRNGVPRLIVLTGTMTALLLMGGLARSQDNPRKQDPQDKAPAREARGRAPKQAREAAKPAQPAPQRQPISPQWQQPAKQRQQPVQQRQQPAPQPQPQQPAHQRLRPGYQYPPLKTQPTPVRQQRPETPPRPPVRPRVAPSPQWQAPAPQVRQPVLRQPQPQQPQTRVGRNAPPPPAGWRQPRVSADYRPPTFRRPDRVQRGWRPKEVSWQPYLWVSLGSGAALEWSHDWHMARTGMRWQSMTFTPNRHARSISIGFSNYVILDRATLWFSSGDVQEVNFGRQDCAPGEYSLIDVDGPWRIRRLTISARTPYGPTDVSLHFYR